MALFTVVMEFDGGTYILQVRANSAQAAASKYAARLPSNKAVATLATRRRLAHHLAEEKPVAIKGVENVWCLFVSVGNKSALVNIVATAAAIRRSNRRIEAFGLLDRAIRLQLTDDGDLSEVEVCVKKALILDPDSIETLQEAAHFYDAVAPNTRKARKYAAVCREKAVQIAAEMDSILDEQVFTRRS